LRVSDLLYVALFAVALPLWGAIVSWPQFERQVLANPVRARHKLWRDAIVWPWTLVAIGAAIWIANDRAWVTLGFVLPAGWRLWLAMALILLLLAYNIQAAVAVTRDPAVRASVAQQFTGQLADVLPHTRRELNWFGAVSLTAGFCEEFLYRGYFLWAMSPWLGWWGAAALSLAIFAMGHAYQGWSGVIRTAVVGALFTLTVAVFGSLWPAIVLHAMVDLGGGLMSWLVLREQRSGVNYQSIPGAT
jgi:membrane protease YdiL (CAAX protease family)